MRIGLEYHSFGSGRKRRGLYAGNKCDLLSRILLPHRVDVPTQPQREGQAWTDLPGVLTVKAEQIIMTRRHTAGTLGKLCRGSQQEISQGVFRNAAVERECAGGGAAVRFAIGNTFQECSPRELVRPTDPIPIVREVVIGTCAFIDGGRCCAKTAIDRNSREAFDNILVDKIRRSQVR